MPPILTTGRREVLPASDGGVGKILFALVAYPDETGALERELPWFAEELSRFPEVTSAHGWSPTPRAGGRRQCVLGKGWPPAQVGSHATSADKGVLSQLRDQAAPDGSPLAGHICHLLEMVQSTFPLSWTPLETVLTQSQDSLTWANTVELVCDPELTVAHSGAGWARRESYVHQPVPLDSLAGVPAADRRRNSRPAVRKSTGWFERKCKLR